MNSEIVCPRCQGSGSITVSRQSTRGERNGNSNLDEDKVRKIRAIHKDYSTRELGIMFGVSQSAIADVIKGRTWSHVQVDYNEAPAID